MVTFKDIDRVHQRPDGTARRNFGKNKKRFIEGQDYIFVQKENQMDENRTFNFSVPPRGITLITEFGYLMLVKSFTDDLSWQVQRQLVNGYFRAKEEIVPSIENFPPAYPKIPYTTSSTPVPKNPNWFQRNRRRMLHIAENANVPVTTLYHHILQRLGEEYDLDAANRIYVEENGKAPRYALDIVSYFPELAKLADEYIDRILCSKF